MLAMSSMVEAHHHHDLTGTKKWQSDDDAAVRRSVLLHMYVLPVSRVHGLMRTRLIVLKQKYGKVDQRISNIARRAELALYTRAHSRDEYGNPRTLCKRLHALIVKLYAHQNEVAKKRTRSASSSSTDSSDSTTSSEDGCDVHPADADGPPLLKRVKREPANSDILVDGHEGVLRTICSFLDTPTLVSFSSASRRARSFIPHCITSLRLRAANLPRTTTDPASWLAQFPHLTTLALVGENRFGFGEIAMENIDMGSNDAVEWLLDGVEATPLPRLKTLAFEHVYCDGLDDPLTARIAALPLPSLRRLVLVGNCVTDVGAMHLASLRRLAQLDVDNNFIGERGAAALAALPSTCSVSMQGNLVPRDDNNDEAM
ncbi:Aste57867_9403 [Aphanomyces stellatus]|uniref:Aste57867_9403 protein n=1 Tax=Aphanomyces stellatus TaxID=120398 RepID=A0A485KMW1_9STRA|nr:hypothetical protein As57867_009367 [Aphanomyces stellatus]VFT86283.1 Aste57867_9403 [Aphanomyces stellatus]